jgi:two-component system chemotaxis response regulator CheY
MKFLIAEDDAAGAKILILVLSEYGQVDWVADGTLALEAFHAAWEEGEPYDVIFLDIMMPGSSGQDVLDRIRENERERGLPPMREVKVVMTTVLDDMGNVNRAFYQGGATAYLVKPIMRENVVEELRKLGIG